MARPVVIVRAELARSLERDPSGASRYVVDVTLGNGGRTPVTPYSVRLLDGETVVGTSLPGLPPLGPGGEPVAVRVAISGLAGPGPGGWEDAPPWLRAGKEILVEVQVARPFPVFLRWLELPQVSDRKTVTVTTAT